MLDAHRSFLDAPVNDEILLFSHWAWQNPDLRDATGRVSGHSGTFVYSFKENVWRRRTPELGRDEVRAARNETIAAMARVNRKLDAQCHFVQPPTGAALVDEMHDLGSPVAAFIRDECEVGPGKRASLDKLHRAYKAWCDDQGREHIAEKATFRRHLPK